MYGALLVEAIRRAWWDVVLRGDASWMRENHGFMFFAVYLSVISVLVSLATLRHT